MQIYVAPYLANVSAVPHVTQKLLASYKDISVGNPPHDGNHWTLCWGAATNFTRYAVMETGFFWNAAHLDTIGLYHLSSLNTVAGQKAIQSFHADRHAIDIIKNSDLPTSKYSQTQNDVHWTGIVLAAQNPHDRSIISYGTATDYWRFVEGACKYYGKHLFIKLHPWNAGKIEKRFQEIAKSYGCVAAKSNHSCISHCRFVLVYNSTFAVDCMVRGVPVAQFAPGYFWQTGAVTYTNYTYPDSVNDTIDRGLRLADFLIYRYCFNHMMPTSRWVDFLHLLSQSKSIFPITPEFAYANNVY